jgi:hypothetical protein
MKLKNWWLLPAIAMMVSGWSKIANAFDEVELGDPAKNYEFKLNYFGAAFSDKDRQSFSKICGVTKVKFRVLKNNARVNRISIHFDDRGNDWDNIIINQNDLRGDYIDPQSGMIMIGMNGEATTKWIDLDGGRRCIDGINVDAQSAIGSVARLRVIGLIGNPGWGGGGGGGRPGDNGPGWGGGSGRDDRGGNGGGSRPGDNGPGWGGGGDNDWRRGRYRNDNDLPARGFSVDLTEYYRRGGRGWRRGRPEGIKLGDRNSGRNMEQIDILNNRRVECGLTNIRLTAQNDTAYIRNIEVVYKNGRTDKIDLNDSNDRGRRGQDWDNNRRHGGRDRDGLFLMAGEPSVWLDVDDVKPESGDWDTRPDGKCIDYIRIYGFSGSRNSRPTFVTVDGWVVPRRGPGGGRGGDGDRGGNGPGRGGRNGDGRPFQPR